MLTIHQLSFHFGGRTLYDEVSLQIKPRDKIGLIGLNGTGKSTLLKLIDGQYQPDGGSISKSNDCTLGFLNQDLLSYQSDESILQVAMQAFERQNWLQKQIDKVLEQMEKNYSDDLVNRLANFQEEFEALDGYSIQAKAEEVLEGLGFSTASLQRPLREFSGGWRMRVMLAKLLLQKPSLLMLDEPTNHLDLPSIQWIEGYLRNYEGAIIVVSHDKEFLNQLCEIIVEVSQQKLNYYKGNYDQYLEQKAERTEIQKNAYENQQAQIRQTERFIERFRAKASKSRQVQSRVKSLERMDMIEDVIEDNTQINLKFTFNQASGRHVCRLEHVSKSYSELTILKNTSIEIERGDKIALIGANGRGKSTLLRVIAGTEPFEGERILGHNVISSFFAQHQLESLNVENTLLQELQQTGTTKPETELRTVLGCFLFSGEEVFKKIKVLSGGEKSRVALAKTLISEANFLLLDEPTNHLDMVSVNILIQAIQQYQGTVVVVSHDRHFVRHIANKIWYIEDYQIKQYPGTYDEYNYWVEQRKANTPASEAKATKVKAEEPKPVKTANTANNTKKIEALEQEIDQLEKEKKLLEDKLSQQSSLQDQTALHKIVAEYDAVKNKIIAKTQDWEKLVEGV